MTTRVRFSPQRGYEAMVNGQWVRISRTTYYQLRNPDISGKTEVTQDDILDNDAEAPRILQKGDRVEVYTITGTVQGATGKVTELGPDVNLPGEYWYRVEFDEPVMVEEGIPTRKLDCSRGELIRMEG